MVFDVAAARDWVIVIAGLLGIIVSIVFAIMIFILYHKVMVLTNKVKEITKTVESMIEPLSKISTWLGGMLANFSKWGARK